MFNELHDFLCGGSIFGLCWTTEGKIADGYKEGMDWWATLDPTWQELMGARQTTIAKVGCECVEYDYGNAVNTVIYYGEVDSDALEDFDILCSPYYGLHTTQLPSDGFILAESAIDGPGMTYPPQFMDGSNHMQMKNDSKMDEAVKKIFKDGLGKSFFKTDKRN